MIHPEGINIHRTIVLEAYISKNNHCNNRYDKDRSQTYAMCTFSVWNHDRKDYTPFEQKDLPKMFKSWISEFKCILYDRYNFQDMYIHSAIEATLCPKIIRQGVRAVQFWLIFSNARNFNITKKKRVNLMLQRWYQIQEGKIKLKPQSPSRISNPSTFIKDQETKNICA